MYTCDKHVLDFLNATSSHHPPLATVPRVTHTPVHLEENIPYLKCKKPNQDQTPMRRQANLVICFGIFTTLLLGIQILKAWQLEFEDAVFLTKNSIKQLQTQYLCKSRRIGCVPEEDTEDNDGTSNVMLKLARHLVAGMDLDLDFPFSNVMNSVFPIDLVVSFNISNTTQEFIARYASFSPVLNGKLTSKYAVIDGHGCSPINSTSHPQYKDKILIVLRGKCTFVKKVTNLVDSDLRPRAVVVANNEPYRNLITMYSSTFNEDGSLTVPILFISNEDYKRLKGLELANLLLTIETASIDNWINLMLLMALSPPLLIVFFYLLLRGIQMCHRRRISTMNQRLVRKMAVFIYNYNHLVPAPKFYEYLTATGQTGDIPLVVSSTEDLQAGTDDTESSAEIAQPQAASSYVINGTDLYSLTNLNLLFAHRDYYPTLKCSICLDRFAPLRSRVLVLECKHIYHESCLLNWLINFRRSCPLCNEPLKLLESLPLLSTETSNYDSFRVDLERGHTSHPWPHRNLAWSQSSHEESSSQYHDAQARDLGTSARTSTVAVRSLQLDSQSSNHKSIGAATLLAHSGESPRPPYGEGDTTESSDGFGVGVGPGAGPGYGIQTGEDYDLQSGMTGGISGAGPGSNALRPSSRMHHSGGLSIDSDASFVTTRTHPYSETSSTHYLTPRQSVDSGMEDTTLSTSSDGTIRNASPNHT